MGIFASCSNDATPKLDSNNIDLSNRGAVKTVTFKGQKVDIATADIVQVKAKANAEQEDAQFVKNMFSNLMAAENKAAQLDVQLTLSESDVKDGMFVFALESADSKALTFELYDEEGFEMAGANEMELNSGKNYKAINVKDLASGAYVMRLKDAEGKELVQKFQVSNQ